MTDTFCPYLISQQSVQYETPMTENEEEIEELKGQIKVLEKKLSFLEELEKTKSPVEEAYKRVYGRYPVTNIGDTCWDGSTWEDFQAGYKSAQKDYKVGEWEPTPQTPEQVADGLKEVFREAIKGGIIPEVDKLSDDFMDKMVAKLKGKTLFDVMREKLGYSIDCCDEIVDAVESWLPKEQSAAGSQNVYVECTVEGFNDCLTKIKRKLR